MLFFFKQLIINRPARVVKGIYLLLIIVLIVSIYEDCSNAAPVPWDLRNRVVGARMMKDGLSPYFFIWKRGNSIRYFDRVYPFAKVSPATASPFFHFMIMWIADLPQFQIDTLWIWVEYLALTITILLLYYSAENKSKKLLLQLLGLGVVFTFTIGWRIHVLVGQNYIFIPMLLAGCYYSIKRSDSSKIKFLLFAVFSVLLLLLRPLTALIFIPFLFFSGQYFKYGITSVCFLMLYILFVWFSPVQKQNWSEYFASIPFHVASHQSKFALDKDNTNQSYFEPTELEGISLTSYDWKKSWNNLSIKGECRNLYIFYSSFTGSNLSIKAMYITAYSSCIILLFPLLIARFKKINLSTEAHFLLGYALYNIYTFCLPITQQQYNWVEILFPLMLLLVCLKQIHIIPLVAISLGIYLNIVTIDVIKFRHNLGEFLIVAVCLFFAYRPLLISKHFSQRLNISKKAIWL